MRLALLVDGILASSSAGVRATAEPLLVERAIQILYDRTSLLKAGVCLVRTTV